jgi:hypothetical protein
MRIETAKGGAEDMESGDITRELRGQRTILKRLYVGCVSLPSSMACLAVFHCPAVGVVADGLNMPRTLVYFPAVIAATVSLREKVYCTGSHMFDCEEG